MLIKRIINVIVQLAPADGTNRPTTFSGSGFNGAGSSMVTLSGMRTSVRIQNSGAPVGCSAQIKVWGMAPSLMYQLATLGLVFNLVPKNQITIQAGDASSGMSTVLTGTILQAYGDYSTQPDVPFVFEVQPGAADLAGTIPPTSIAGVADVASIMAGLARQRNMGFMNYGVTSKLTNVYVKGSPKSQTDQIADQAIPRIKYSDTGRNLEIWPITGSRKTPTIPIISPRTVNVPLAPGNMEMIGYPAFTQQGIIVETLFDARVAFGGLIQVQSSVLSGIAATQASAASAPFKIGVKDSAVFPTVWAVNKLDLALDSLVPKGEWKSTIYAYNPNYAAGIIPPGGSGG